MVGKIANIKVIAGTLYLHDVSKEVFFWFFELEVWEYLNLIKNHRFFVYAQSWQSVGAVMCQYRCSQLVWLTETDHAPRPLCRCCLRACIGSLPTNQSTTQFAVNSVLYRTHTHTGTSEAQIPLVASRHHTTSTTCRASRDVTCCFVLCRACCTVLVPIWQTTKKQ